MTIQDELKTAADATRREVEAQVDTGAALEATRARAIGIRRRPDGRVLLAVAASVVGPPDTPTGADAVGHRRGR